MGGGAAGFGTSARPHRPCVVLDRFAAVVGQAHHSDVDLLVRGAEPGSCAGGMVGALREWAALLEERGATLCAHAEAADAAA